MSKLEAIGLGAMNVDYLYRVKQVVTDGESIVDKVTALPGGSAANTIYALAKLGLKTGFMGIVGDDEGGNLLLEDFKSVNVDTSQIHIAKGKKTGSVLCLSDELGRRALYVSPGVNSQLKKEQIDLHYVNQGQLIHYSSFVNDEQFNIQLKLAEEKADSIMITLAPGMLYANKGLKLLAPLLKNTYILFANREEIEALTGRNFRDGVKDCLKHGCRIVVVTFGKGLTLESGRIITSYISDGEHTCQIEGVKEKPSTSLETTGAGDAFAAGFLFGFLKGKGLKECGILGDLMARFAITEAGARKGLPTSSQLSCKYSELYGENS